MNYVTLGWEICLMWEYESVSSSLNPFLWGILDTRNHESNLIINLLLPMINQSQKFRWVQALVTREIFVQQISKVTERKLEALWEHRLPLRLTSNL